QPADGIDEVLLVTAFGDPNERTTVSLTWQPGGDQRRGQSPTVGWNALPPSRSQRDCQRTARVTPKSTPNVPVRLASLHGSFDAVSPADFEDRALNFPGSHRHDRECPEVRCRAHWTGSRCRIWIPDDEPCDDRLIRWLGRLGDLVEEESLPIVEADQGTWPDVDADGIINLVVTDRVGCTAPGVHAFVWQADFQENVTRPWDQNWDVIYVQPGIDFEALRPILIHELTHLAQFSWCRHLFPTGPWPIPDWLTEGLAHAAELRYDEAAENTLPRLRAFAAHPGSCPLVVNDAAASGLWRDPGQRGASAAFCDWWLRRQPDWCWPDFLQTYATEDDPWTMIAGAPFTEIYRDWTISLAANGLQPLAEKIPVELHFQELSEGTAGSVVLIGTATAYVRVRRNSTEPQSVQITGPKSCRLQVTTLRIPSRSSVQLPATR
ncbi:MAG: hypothetical protein B7Z55_09560, partial [Planctomycetales bacterium 12-60-4]